MNDQRSPPSPPEEPGPALPLQHAALALCAPQLVADLRAARAAFNAAKGGRPAVHLFPTKEEEGTARFAAGGRGLEIQLERQTQQEVQGGFRPILNAWHALREAVKRLEADMREQIESGEIRLEGLKVKPSVAEVYQRLPAVWARHLTFLVSTGRRNTILN